MRDSAIAIAGRKDAKFGAFTRSVPLPDDVLEVIYKKIIISELKVKLMGFPFHLAETSSIHRKLDNRIYRFRNPDVIDPVTNRFFPFETEYHSWYSVKEVLNETVFTYMTSLNISLFMYVFGHMYWNKLWKYATESKRDKLVRSLNKDLPIHFSFDRRDVINLDTCVTHIIYMNEHGLEAYIDEVDKDHPNWMGLTESKLWIPRDRFSYKINVSAHTYN